MAGVLFKIFQRFRANRGLFEFDPDDFVKFSDITNEGI